jgi:hypothetical protein
MLINDSLHIPNESGRWLAPVLPSMTTRKSYLEGKPQFQHWFQASTHDGVNQQEETP